jgi:transposase
VGVVKPEVIPDQEHEQIWQRACAVDIGKEFGTVCVRVPDEARPGRRVSRVWDVKATTAAVTGLADHLVCEQVQKISVESTSDYWRIFFYLFEERGLDVQLVNPRDVKNAPGRPKTDKHDSVWSCKVTEKGLLRPSFVPPKPIRQLRDYTRMRVDLAQERTRHKQRLEKLLEDALIKVSAVASKLDTQSVRDMVEALIRGERNPRVLARLARGKMKAKHDALVEALEGRFDDHHAVLARMLLDQIDGLTAQIDRLTAGIEAMIAQIPAAQAPETAEPGQAADHPAADPAPDAGPAVHTDPPADAYPWAVPAPDTAQPADAADDPPANAETDPPADADPGADNPPADGHGEDRRPLSAVARLAEIPGFGPVHAQAVIAEVGLDMNRFPTAEHLVSWAKLCPRTHQSGSKTRSGKTGKGNPYLKGTLGEAAASAGRTQTFLGERFRRLARRRGKLKALVAVARSMLVSVWHLLRDPTARYRDLGPDYYTAHLDKKRKVRGLTHQFEALGYYVTLTPIP